MIRTDLNIELNLAKDCFNMRDSMCYDSGTIALTAKVKDGEDTYDVVIRAQGAVRVRYNNEMYKCASQMPSELIDKFYRGVAYDNGEVECDENNWWEVEISKNGVYVDYLGGFMDFNPCDFEGVDDIQNYLVDSIFNIAK